MNQEIQAQIAQLKHQYGLQQIIVALAELEMMETRPESQQQQHRCSFCGRSGEQAPNLIAGTDASICVDCVGLCNQIIAQHHHKNGA